LAEKVWADLHITEQDGHPANFSDKVREGQNSVRAEEEHVEQEG